MESTATDLVAAISIQHPGNQPGPKMQSYSSFSYLWLSWAVSKCWDMLFKDTHVPQHADWLQQLWGTQFYRTAQPSLWPSCGLGEADAHSSVSSQIRWKTLHTPSLISQMKDDPKFPGGVVGDNMVLCKQKYYLQGNISQGLATLTTACGALSLWFYLDS